MKILVARTTEEIESAYTILSDAPATGSDTATSSQSARDSSFFYDQLSDGI